MPKTSQNDRKVYYERAAAIYGEICFRCHREGDYLTLIVHHSDNNNDNNDPDNHYLFCISCNAVVDPRGKVRPSYRTNRARTTPSSSEMQKSMGAKPAFLSWLWDVIVTVGFIEYEDCVDEAAVRFNISELTAQRYIKRALRRAFELSKEQDKEIIQFKPEHHPRRLKGPVVKTRAKGRKK